MKVRADEHVSRRLVKAVREMALSDGWILSHVIDEGQSGSSDVHWITQFANDGGDAILTGDTDFFATPQQIVAVEKTGMKVIHFPPKWANAKIHLQAAHALLWWKRIEKTIATMKGRECYRTPWSLTESGELTKVTVDYAEAHKKVRKADRRNSPA